MVSLLGLLMFLPFSIYEAAHFDFLTVTVVDWLMILYFGVVVTVLAFFLMYQGLQKVPAHAAGVMTGVLPISTLFLSMLFLHETFLWYRFAGMACVLLAIYLVSRNS